MTSSVELPQQLDHELANDPFRRSPFTSFYHLASLVTADSQIPHNRTIARPQAERIWRASALREVWANYDHMTVNSPIFTEAHQRDEIAKQYLNRGRIHIEDASLGTVEAEYVDMLPPQNTPDDKPPIFFIPGISNDIDSVNTLLMEVARTRRIICCGYPDSSMGKVSDKFLKAVIDSNTFDAHAAFFTKVLHELLPQGNVEIWGFSTGSPIAATLLNDETISQRVTNAVLISPAASFEQTQKEVLFGAAREALSLFSRPRKLPNYTFIHREELDDPQEELKKAINMTLTDRISHPLDLYKTMRVQPEGKIIVLSGKRDHVTKSHQAWSTFLDNLAVQFINNRSGAHNTPLLEAKDCVQFIERTIDIKRTNFSKYISVPNLRTNLSA